MVPYDDEFAGQFDPASDPTGMKRAMMLRQLAQELNAVPLRRQNDLNAAASQFGFSSQRNAMESQHADNLRNIRGRAEPIPLAIPGQARAEPIPLAVLGQGRAEPMSNRDAALDAAGATMRKRFSGWQPGTAVMPHEQKLMMRGLQPMQASMASEGPTAQQMELLAQFKAHGPEALSSKPSSVMLGAGDAGGRSRAHALQQSQRDRANQFRQARAQQIQQAMQAQQFMRLDPRVQSAIATQGMEGQRLSAASKSQEDQFRRKMEFDREQRGLDRQDAAADRKSRETIARETFGARTQDGDAALGRMLERYADKPWLQSEIMNNAKFGTPFTPEAQAILKGKTTPGLASVAPGKPQKPGLVAEVVGEFAKRKNPSVPLRYNADAIFSAPMFSY